MNLIIHSFLAVFVLLGFSSLSLAQQTLNAQVVGVVDGDTITVLTKDKRQMMIRLADIDAPEKEQDYGINSYLFLSSLISNQTVTLSNVKKDCLDRLTASVAFNKKDLSLMAIKSGNAWADASCSANEMLSKEESLAKEKKLGLWENGRAIRPSEFSKMEKPVQPAVAQTNNRRIFTGLGSTPPPIIRPDGRPSGIEIGMSFKDFTKICGDSGTKSTMSTTESRKSFYTDVPGTKENTSKGCFGHFSFDKSPDEADFKLWGYDQ